MSKIYAVKIFPMYAAVSTITHLVRADTRAQAVAHVARNTIKAEIPTQDDFAELIRRGVEIEQAGEQKQSDLGDNAQ